MFSQTQQMLDILEKHVAHEGYEYRRMDGTTTVAARAGLIDDFNENPDVFIFLLTTKVKRHSTCLFKGCLPKPRKTMVGCGAALLFMFHLTIS